MNQVNVSHKDLNSEVVRLLKDIYGVEGKAARLAGDVDLNFRITVDGVDAYTFKISESADGGDDLRFQSALLDHLANKELPFATPKMKAALDGSKLIDILDENGHQRYVRMLTWVSGRMLADANPRSEELLFAWGKTCGHLSAQLLDFAHPGAHRSFAWNPSETFQSKKLAKYFTEKEHSEIAHFFWQLFEEQTLPKLPQLRKSVNYSDAHEHNIMLAANSQAPQISGVIDFGDAVYSETINELAIACAYGGMYKNDPIAAMAQMVRGYNSVFPIQENELEVLFSLITARLLITVAHAAHNKYKDPDNEYHVISEKPAWDLLRKLRTTNRNFAHYTFRSAVGLEPVPQAKAIRDWLAAHRDEFHPVMSLEGKKLGKLDLSVGSLTLGNNADWDTIEQFDKTISRHLEDTSIEVGHGGYLETRPVYTTDAYKEEGNNGARWRTVHLGLDLWTSPLSEVFAPLQGVVHGLADNNNPRDYGPTVILKHEAEGIGSFYTLYGHLSRASISKLSEGQIIEKGECFAEIGRHNENGQWPAHLHFQIVLDLLGNESDFPGVAFPEEVDVWQSLCPDPRLMIPNMEIEDQPSESIADLLDQRNQRLYPNLSVSYSKPLHMVRGYKQYLYDTNGRRYLDTVNNVAHVGHEHPAIIKAAQQQMGVLNTNTRYLHSTIIEYAERLLAIFPPELCVVQFVNSGSEANELALRMMETYTGQKDVIAVEVGYHGNTGGTINISSYKFDSKGGKGCPPHTHIVPMPDTYRGVYKDPATAGVEYASYVGNIIEKVKNDGRGIKGFIGESILSCGGQIVLPDGYLKEVYKQVRGAGGLCVADEVQVGFGRVGKHFWGFELQGVVPDIVTLGKPIGNGHPLAAVVTTRAVADAFANGMEYFNTFGGNPVSATIGLEVLNVIERENLQQQAKEKGEYLLEKLRNLQDKYLIIGDVRGHGLFLGFELVKDRQSKEPAAEQTAYLADRMRTRGFLMSTDGPLHNVIKIKPPMCISYEDIDDLLFNLQLVFSEDFMQVSSIEG